MKQPRLKIVFDRSNAIFYAGEVIRGRVIVPDCLKENEEFVEITWDGKHHVFWETQHPTAPDKVIGPPKKTLPGERPSETDTLIYFHKTEILTNFVQKKNHLEFEFSFQIPPECMPNCKGKFGGIAYWVTVKTTVSRETAKGFDVLASSDRPFSHTFSNLAPCKTVQGDSGAIFKDGSYSMQISLPKRHYNRGETLIASVVFTNATTKPIVNFAIQLIQKLHYHSNHTLPICPDQRFRSCKLYRNFRRNEKIPVAEAKSRLKIDPGQSFETEFSIDIPKKSVPTFESSLISVGYFLSFTSKTTSIFSKLTANIGITVGARKIPKIIVEESEPSSSSPPPSYHSDCPEFHERLQ